MFLPIRLSLRRLTAWLALIALLLAPAACSRGAGDAGIESKVSDDGPHGLFFMTRYWATMHSLEKAVWYFAPQGKVYQNLEHGVTEADLAAHTGPKGSYKMAGAQMVVTWSDGKQTATQFEHNKGEPGFAWDGGLFGPVKPFEKAASIAGSYEGGESVSGGGNSVAVARSMDLRADGTYSTESVSSLKATSAGSQLSGGAQGGQKGKWSLSGYTMTLTGDDGSVKRWITFPYDDEKTPVYPDHLFLGGMLYKHR